MSIQGKSTATNSNIAFYTSTKDGDANSISRTCFTSINTSNGFITVQRSKTAAHHSNESS